MLVARERGTVVSSAACATCTGPLLEGDAFCPNCGSPIAGVNTTSTQSSDTRADERAVDVAWAEARQRLEQATMGQLEIKKELGRGGMAAVFLAHEVALNRKVAVKVMAPGLLTGSGMISRFKQEAVTVANLSHPNIVSIYSVQQHENLHYFVMKFVEGRSLEFVLDCEGALPLATMQAILYQVGSGLAYAHRRRIVHRDIKPANIMLDSDGMAVVMDFGIAKVTEQPGQTQVGTVIGTPSYMSPEQCYAKDITWSSDQYSLGIVAYEMLTGQVPFSGPSFVVMQGHTSQPPPPIEPLRPDCPPEVIAAVVRMLEKDPDKRFPSMAEALDALGAAPIAEGDPLRQELMRLATLPSAARRGERPRTPHSAMPAFGASMRRGTPSMARNTGDETQPKPAPAKNRTWLFAGGGVGLAVAAVAAWFIMKGTGVPSASDSAKGGSTTAAAAPVVGVAIEGADSVLVGQSSTLRARLTDSAGASLSGRLVAWNTDDSTVAMVEGQNGEATLQALKPGTVKIVAASEGKSIERAITIVAPLANRVTVSSPNTQLAVGESVPLAAVLTDSLGAPIAGTAFAWRSSDARIVEVARDGRVTARGPGRARLFATAGTRSGSIELGVSGVRARAITVAPPPAASLKVGSRVTLHATIEWERTVPGVPRIAWQSTNPAVAAIVSSDSLNVTVNLLAEGSAAILASMDNATTAAPITVGAAAVAQPVRVDLSRTTVAFDVGADGRVPEAQTVSVTVSGGTGREQPSLGEVDYAAGPNGWVDATLDPATPGVPSTLTLRVVPRGVAPGTHRASIPIAASGQTRTLAVALTVAAATVAPAGGGGGGAATPPSGATAARDELEALIASYEDALNAGDQAKVRSLFPDVPNDVLRDTKRRGSNDRFTLIFQPRTLQQTSDTEANAVVGASIGGSRSNTGSQARVLYRFRKVDGAWKIAGTALAR
jgi:eukaryotic-like serine/threonine-protein kinase